MRWPFGKSNEQRDLGLTVDRSSDQIENFKDEFGDQGQEQYNRWLLLYKKYQKTPEEYEELVKLTSIADKYRE
ncbi:MAG: hypothetical protein AAB729_04665 [Patescibacteria group bacterium]